MVVKKYLRIAKELTPNDVAVVYHCEKWNVGEYDPVNKTIYVPLPTDRGRLYTYLHELAHHTLHNKENDVEFTLNIEYDADMWAFQKMRDNDVRITKKISNNSKMYIAFYYNNVMKMLPGFKVRQEITEYVSDYIGKEILLCQAISS